MNKEELIEVLRQFDEKRVEELPEKTRNIFYAIMKIADERDRLNNIISQIETLIINHNCDTGDIYYKYNGKYLKSELKERIIELVELKENKQI